MVDARPPSKKLREWGRGATCIETGEFYSVKWSNQEIDVARCPSGVFSVPFFELYNMLSAACTWVKHSPGWPRWVILTDSTTAVKVATSLYSSSVLLTTVVRKFMSILLLSQSSVSFHYVPRCHIKVADALSRGNVPQARSYAHRARRPFRVDRQLIPLGLPPPI